MISKVCARSRRVLGVLYYRSTEGQAGNALLEEAQTRIVYGQSAKAAEFAGGLPAMLGRRRLGLSGCEENPPQRSYATLSRVTR